VTIPRAASAGTDNSLKISTAAAFAECFHFSARMSGCEETQPMTAKTCAACDCELDANAIKVKIGGNTVEVCCEACAVALKEADNSTQSAKPLPHR
jgi:hypothetical protein